MALRRRPARGGRLGRAALVVPGGGLAARLHAELVEDVGNVALDRVRAEVEGARDQLVAVAGGDELQHVELARAERLGGDQDRRAGARPDRLALAFGWRVELRRRARCR